MGEQEKNYRICRNFSQKFVDFFEKRRIINIRMDTQKKRKMASEKDLSQLKGKRTVAGAKQLRKAVLSGVAKEVFLAMNADPAITEPIEALCQQNNVSYAWVRSMTDLGRACGIDVGAAAAAAVE